MVPRRILQPRSSPARSTPRKPALPTALTRVSPARNLGHDPQPRQTPLENKIRTSQYSQCEYWAKTCKSAKSMESTFRPGDSNTDIYINQKGTPYKTNGKWRECQLKTWSWLLNTHHVSIEQKLVKQSQNQVKREILAHVFAMCWKYHRRQWECNYANVEQL